MSDNVIELEELGVAFIKDFLEIHKSKFMVGDHLPAIYDINDNGLRTLVEEVLDDEY